MVRSPGVMMMGKPFALFDLAVKVRSIATVETERRPASADLVVERRNWEAAGRQDQHPERREAAPDSGRESGCAP